MLNIGLGRLWSRHEDGVQRAQHILGEFSVLPRAGTLVLPSGEASRHCASSYSAASLPSCSPFILQALRHPPRRPASWTASLTAIRAPRAAVPQSTSSRMKVRLAEIDAPEKA